MRLSSTGYALGGLSVLSLATVGPDCDTAWSALHGNDFDSALRAAATLLLVAVSGWVLCGIATVLLADSAGALGGVARLFAPRILRRALFVGAAGALVVGPVSAVSDGEVIARSGSASLLSQSLDGLPLPDRPVSPATSAATAGTDTSPPAVAPTTITVRAGDSLWAIAKRHLPAGADNAEIGAATMAWHDANRDRIGADPDLILPGQRLTSPAKES